MTARRVAAALLLSGLLVSGGCLGFLTGDKALTREADDVRVSEDARSQAGYSETRDTTQKITRNFSAAGQSRTVEVTNHLAEYKRKVEIPIVAEQELARFTVLSTPKFKLAGKTFNPVGDMSNRELAQRLQKQYKTVDDVQFRENRTVTALGEKRTVAKFDAKAETSGGEPIDVTLHITKFAHGDDFIVAVAVYPKQLDNEEERVDTLIGGIEHETG